MIDTPNCTALCGNEDEGVGAHQRGAIALTTAGPAAVFHWHRTLAPRRIFSTVQQYVDRTIRLCGGDGLMPMETLCLGLCPSLGA